MIAVSTRQEKGRSQERRIKRILKWLDGETTPEMIALYRQSAVEAHGSVETMLAADEAAMREERASK